MFLDDQINAAFFPNKLQSFRPLTFEQMCIYDGK